MDETDLIGLLKSSQRKLQREKITAYRRRVGYGDLLTDREENAREYGFGSGTTCYDSALVIGEVAVGANCWIGPSCILDGSGGLVIGDWVTVSLGVIVASHSTIERMLSGGRLPAVTRRTMIGSRVVIGPGAFVGMGVHIGDCCVIAPHAVVTRNVPAGSIVQGDPGRVIGRVTFTEDGHPQLLLDRKRLKR